MKRIVGFLGVGIALVCVLLPFAPAVSATETSELVGDAQDRAAPHGIFSGADPQGTAGGTLTLSVVKDGSGSGSVSVATGGISCGTTCSAQYPYGAVVTLEAAPTPGSSFAGWGGACSGTGSCEVRLMSETTVTATFTADPPPEAGLKLTVGKARLNRRNGTALLPVRVSEAATVTLTGRFAVSVTRSTSAAATVWLKITPKGALRTKLIRTGRVRMRLTITARSGDEEEFKDLFQKINKPINKK